MIWAVLVIVAVKCVDGLDTLLNVLGSSMTREKYFVRNATRWSRKIKRGGDGVNCVNCGGRITRDGCTCTMPERIWVDRYGEYSEIEAEMPSDSTEYIRADITEPDLEKA